MYLVLLNLKNGCIQLLKSNQKRENVEGQEKMALTDLEIAEMLIKLRDKMPDVYRHIVGIILSVTKVFE